VSASTIGTAAILWLIFMQIISSSMGGYLAGRLRHEMGEYSYGRSVFSAIRARVSGVGGSPGNHGGFLAAAAASMVGATASSAAGGTGRATGVQAEGREFDPNEYFIDTLFRSESAKPDSNSTSVRGEAGRILRMRFGRGIFRQTKAI